MKWRSYHNKDMAWKLNTYHISDFNTHHVFDPMKSERTMLHDPQRTIVKESQKRIKKSLVAGFEYDHLVVAKSNRFLRKHVYKKLDFGVIYVDMVDSTEMSMELGPDLLSKIITVFSQEVSYVIEYFDGLVLKFMADAVIGYFPHSNQKNNLDDIIICAESIVDVVRYSINPFLLQMGHNGIKIKVTSDYGSHTIVRYGSDQKRSSVDIISATMNLSAKMQSLAKPSQMVIGRALYQKLSKGQQRMFDRAKFGNSRWTYNKSADQKPYRLYVITL